MQSSENEHSEFIFKLLDLPAYGTLRQAEFVCRARKTAVARNHLKSLQECEWETR
jgi:hypothetical protein